jgi:hypothetical protein
MPSLLSDIIGDKEGIYSKMKGSICQYKYDNGTIIKKIEEVF